MNIEVAKLAGFCPGVKNAVDTVYRLIEQNRRAENVPCRLYTLGKLIHNPHIIRDLQRAGVNVIEPQQLLEVAATCNFASPVAVVIRTHGIAKGVLETLHRLETTVPGFHVVDCTCPFVRKIHRIASEHTDEDTVLAVFGDPKHPEVRAIVSYAGGEAVVLSSSDDANLCKLAKKKVVVVSQTTQNLREWEICQKNIKNLCTNAIFFDTICSVTENRQKEAAALAAKADLVLIVGGKESSNTSKLHTVAAEAMERSGRGRGAAFRIEDASDLKQIPCELLSVTQTVGITAGASTPGSIIQEVYNTMSEIQHSEDFVQLLNESFKTLNTGDIVKGTVTSVSANELHVDLSGKVTGVVPFDEVTDDSSVKLTDLYKVGDEIEAQAFRVSDIDGIATLSIKRIQRISNWKKIVAAAESGEILEGKVQEAVKGGVIVSCLFSKIFIPAAQTGVPKDGDLSSLKGQVVRFKIIDVDENRNRAVGSIRQVQREERKAKLAKFWEEIEVGKKYTGTVKSMTSYGAFVDLGGIDGMVHTTELSWTRIKSPADVVSVGDQIDVFVKSFDQEKKRISLGYKTEETNPWKIFTETYAVGDVASVKIVSLMPFGAFAEVVPGADGLIHISQIADHKIATPGEALQIGEVVDAKIIGIDEENKKISLSIRALLEETEEAPEEPVEEIDQ